MSYSDRGGYSSPRGASHPTAKRNFGPAKRFGGASFSNRSNGNRGFQRSRNFGPKRSSIHPSKYINHQVAEQETLQIEITHQFSDFGLDEALLENVLQHGYEVPTPIQDKAIPVIMEGRDVVGLANTGTGKTAAFLLPLIHRILNDNTQGALVVVPTRELAVQIADEWHKFAYRLPISMTMCIGGTNIYSQISSLRKSPHFVIGTPGRLKDLINRGALDTSQFTNIVLDEVDRMLDIGFIHDIEFLVDHLPQPRHSYFFSATITREVEQVMHKFLYDPVQISVKTRESSDHIHQDIIKIGSGGSKVQTLIELLAQPEFEKVIVFGRTKHGINKLERMLADQGLRVAAIHGNKTQDARQRSLEVFKKGVVQALLATDVAARGIDIPNVTHVINFDEPESYEDYIHRIGRTGRAGKFGKALTFVVGA
jgi:superfamily II DNA/RNA helicase